MTPVTAVRALLLSLSFSLLAASARADDMPTAKVNIRSDEPDTVVGLVKGRSFAVGGGVMVAGVGWDEKCTAPCSFEAQSGFRELVFRSPNFMFFHETRLRPGDNNFYIDPGNRGMRIAGNTLSVLGMLSFITGGVILLTRSFLPENESDGSPNKFREKTTWALPLTIGGGVALGGGITLSYLGRIRVEELGNGQPATSAQGLMLRAQRSF